MFVLLIVVLFIRKVKVLSGLLFVSIFIFIVNVFLGVRVVLVEVNFILLIRCILGGS